MSILDDTPAAVGDEYLSLAEEVRFGILAIVIAGWHQAAQHADVIASSLEVPLTERLRDGMREVCKSNAFSFAKAMMVLPGTESRSSNALIPDGRTDIPLAFLEVRLQRGDHEPHAVIECKRLSGGDAHLCREYVVEGIDRFRLGKYGFKHRSGFMVGYVIAGTPLEAAQGVNNHLVRVHRASEKLTPGSAANNWLSIHARHASVPITLYHALLGFPP